MHGQKPLVEDPVNPTTTRTFPLGSSVAVRVWRPALRLPVMFHVPVAGSYISAVLRAEPPPTTPPATNTLPSGSSVAVCPKRAVLRLPVALQVPLAGS